MTREPILHLAQRSIKTPEALNAGEIKRLAEWVVLAFREKQRENASQALPIRNVDNGLFAVARARLRTSHG